MQQQISNKVKEGKNEEETPIILKAVAHLHKDNSCKEPHCPLFSTFTAFHFFLQRLHTTLCWQSWSGELPGTHVRALSSLAEYRNCHELPGLSCMQLLLEQPYSLMTYFQILLDNRRVRGGLVRRLKVKVQRKAIQNLNYVLCDHPAPCVDITKHNSSPGLYRLLYLSLIHI